MNLVKDITLVTVTQLSRAKTLKLLKEQVEYQTFKHRIYEWIIVEGSQSVEDAKANYEHIMKLADNCDVNIIYVRYETVKKIKPTLGRLRNKCNNVINTYQTKYVVCLDDDDWYPVDRVEHAVTELEKSDKMIAGCSNVLVYDYLLDQQFHAGDWGHWASNGTLAYKIEYLKDHKYDDTKSMGEEKEFLGNSELLQLDPLKVCILNSHGINTYNKREMLLNAYWNIHPRIKPMNCIMPREYLGRYKNIFCSDKKRVGYDIVYCCGFFGIDWDPEDKKLGGSEQAVVELSSQWGKNLKVAVYGKVPEKCVNGVYYFPMNQFPYDKKFDTLIIWREGALFSVLPFNVKAKNLYFDLHDNVKLSSNKHVHKRFIEKFDKVFFKSKFHKEEYEREIEVKLNEKAVIIPNGIKYEIFDNLTRQTCNMDVDSVREKDFDIKREPFRFCYASCYTRGLIEILTYIWPIIRKSNNRAEFHIYYGMENVKDEKIINLLKLLMSQEGVMDHGRQDCYQILEEKKKSTYHLYISNTDLETDCISIKESILAGCIPLISNDKVFAERAGIHFDMIEYKKEDYERTAKKIIEIMNRPDHDLLYDDICERPEMLSWSACALLWAPYI